MTMKTIALVIENSREYGRGLIRGIAAYGQQRRDWLLRLLRPHDLSAPGALDGYDGVIARIADRRTLRLLKDLAIPVVDVFGHFTQGELIRVETDDTRVGRIAADYFLGKGYTSFAFCGFAGTGYSDVRRDGFLARLREAGQDCAVYAQEEPPDGSVVFDERPVAPRDPSVLAAWLKSLAFPVAIFCANDLRAFQLLQLAHKLGIDVPREAAILGTDNDMLLCTFSTPPLSSIDPNAYGVGYAAARLLQAAMDRPPRRKTRPSFRVNPGELYERTSTEHHPTTPAWFAEALVHIDRNLSRPIAPADVVAVTGKSSTAVEKRFRAAYGMSVGRYILALKMKEARRLLARGDLSVKEVSAKTGFNTQQYFCRAYRSYFGHPPSQRRQSSQVQKYA